MGLSSLINLSAANTTAANMWMLKCRVMIFSYWLIKLYPQYRTLFAVSTYTLILMQRENAVDNFRAGKTWVLIATDVVARGMDFKGINCVINYDFPDSAAAYIHRIGKYHTQI